VRLRSNHTHKNAQRNTKKTTVQLAEDTDLCDKHALETRQRASTTARRRKFRLALRVCRPLFPCVTTVVALHTLMCVKLHVDREICVHRVQRTQLNVARALALPTFKTSPKQWFRAVNAFSVSGAAQDDGNARAAACTCASSRSCASANSPV
jgi:hypothetical protein